MHDPMHRLSMEPREVLRLLESVSLLAELSVRERGVLAEFAEVTQCGRDVQIVNVGQEVRWWYVLLQGRVDVSVRAPDGTLPIVRELAAGQSIALDAVLSGTPSTSQITAISDAVFVRWQIGELQGLLRARSPVAVKLQVALTAELGKELRAATSAVIRLVS